MTTTLLVTGDRELEDRKLIFGEIESYCPDLVLVGDCPSGVDKIVREWCAEHLGSHQWYAFKAQWAQFGGHAGPMRNTRMVRKARELDAFVLAFPRGGPGTADCIAQARRAGLQVRER